MNARLVRWVSLKEGTSVWKTDPDYWTVASGLELGHKTWNNGPVVTVFQGLEHEHKAWNNGLVVKTVSGSGTEEQGLE